MFLDDFMGLQRSKYLSYKRKSWIYEQPMGCVNKSFLNFVLMLVYTAHWLYSMHVVAFGSIYTSHICAFKFDIGYKMN